MAEKELTPLKKGKSSFVLVGAAKVTKFTFGEETSKNNWASRKMSLLVDTGNGNLISCELRGGYSVAEGAVNKIYCRGIKKDDKGNVADDFSKSVEVAWEDRLDPEIIATCADNNKIKVGLETDNKGATFVKEFLSAYDAVDYIKENLKDGMVVNIKGNIEYNMYNDVVSLKKVVKTIFLSKAQPENYKAEFQQTILVDSDSVQALDKDKNIFPINARVVEYIGKVNNKQIKKNVALPYEFELENRLDKPQATELFIKNFLRCKGDKIIALAVEGKFVEGAAVTQTKLEDLPDDIQVLVNTGLLAEDEALGMMSVGSKEKRAIITRPLVIKNTKEDGTVSLEVSCDKDLYVEDDLISYQSVVETSEEKVEQPKVEKVVEKESTNVNDTDDWLKTLGIENI